MTRWGLLGALMSLVIATVLILTLLPVVSASTTAGQAGAPATVEIAYQTTQAVPPSTTSPTSETSSAPPLLLLVAGSIIVVGLALRRASSPYVEG